MDDIVTTTAATTTTAAATTAAAAVSTAATAVATARAATAATRARAPAAEAARKPSKWCCLSPNFLRHHRAPCRPESAPLEGDQKAEQELAQIPPEAAATVTPPIYKSASTTEQVVKPPDHLLIMVNGIVGSAKDWKYAADQFIAKHGEKVVVYRSSCNCAVSTFHGVDVMGKRLAEEVSGVISKTPDLAKISFLAHSLGGLVARFAISLLYVAASSNGLEMDMEKFEVCELSDVHKKGTLQRLQPINFITVATPHLGTRWHKQLPFLCGCVCLEKLAPHVAPVVIRATGAHLFLADGSQKKLPLLHQMTTNCPEGLFISALRDFKRRVVYSNACCDYIVGRRTSSLRRKTEKPKVKNVAVNPKYPHILNVEEVPLSDCSLKEFCSTFPVSEPNRNQIGLKTSEEKLLEGLTQLKWQRIDVSFRGSCQRFCAHSTIQVKRYRLHSDGADVISHIIDNFEF